MSTTIVDDTQYMIVSGLLVSYGDNKKDKAISE